MKIKEVVVTFTKYDYDGAIESFNNGRKQCYELTQCEDIIPGCDICPFYKLNSEQSLEYIKNHIEE